MLKALTTQFKFVVDPSATYFDGLYVASTLLNPAYRGLLDTNQISHAKKFLKELIALASENEDSIGGIQESEEKEDSLDEPPPKRFKHLSQVTELLRIQEGKETEVVELEKDELQIENYLKCKPSTDDMQLDPIQYWVNKVDSYPLLSPIACHILTTPASTAPAERTFSVSGKATKRRRNCLTDYNLERETLLHKNKLYIN